MNQTDIDKANTEWLASTLYSVYADLEYALSEELETGTYPSNHLMDTVEMWANRLHTNGVLSVDDFATAMGIVERAKAMIYDGGRVQCLVCGAYSPWENTHISEDTVVCPDCENAKGGWEDPRLDEYGRLVK